MSRVITFYSYKGGTGRSMALANVAWILASAGKRVLTIDWDLEAPGLHRYFQPFLTDKELSGQESQGVIDMAIDFAVRAATHVKQGETLSGNWYEAYADFSKWRQKLRWPSGAAVRLGKDGTGEIDFVPAGRQSADYAKRLNNFDWHSFYGKLRGGAFFDAAKGKFALYDYVLIDSRTGVSDTSGICTVQMPDTLVVCFTLNFQSIKGAAAVAQSVKDQCPKMRFLPVPMRIDAGEEKSLNRMKSYAADVFTPFLDSNINQEEFWFSMEVPYHARYAYAEKLALFEEQASITASTLPAMVRLSAYVTAGDVRTAGPLPERERRLALAEFEGVEPAEAPPATAAASEKSPAAKAVPARALLKGDWPRQIKAFLDEYLVSETGQVPFGGRDRELERLDAWLSDEKAAPRMLVTAPAGRGKSALVVQWMKSLQDRGLVGEDKWQLAFMPISIQVGTNRPSVFLGCLAHRLSEITGETVPREAIGNPDALKDVVQDQLEAIASRGKRVLVVLDGLDQALQGSLDPTIFPKRLPPTLRILLSARLLVGDIDSIGWLGRLGWDRNIRVETLELERLSPEAIENVLSKLGAPTDVLARQRNIVDRLSRLTEGEPLLVRFYAEDLWLLGRQHAGITIEDLDRLKPGIGGYFDKWLTYQEQLWDDENLKTAREEVDGVLSILAFALGPLESRDLLGLMKEIYPRDDLSSEHRLLQPLRRFVIGNGRADSGYVLSHPRIAHYLQYERFGANANALREKFAVWGLHHLRDLNATRVEPKNASRYTLQFLRGHFEEAGRPATEWMEFVEDGWRRAWEQFESIPRGFASDVQAAWDRGRWESRQTVMVATEWRCALVLSSIRSIGLNTPDALLCAAVTFGLLSIRQALHFIDIGRSGGAAVSLLLQLSQSNSVNSIQSIDLIFAALEKAFSCGDERDRAHALGLLAPHLSPEQTNEALAAAKAIGDEGARAHALGLLAPHLLPEQKTKTIAEALAAATAIRNEGDRARVLASLAPQLSPEQKTKTIADALAAAKAIGNERDRAHALGSLAPHLSPEQTADALAAAKAIGDEGARAHVLGLLAPHLSPQLTAEALAAAKAIGDEGDRVAVLASLAPHLSPRQIAEALAAARAIGNERDRARALGSLAPHLSPEQTAEALATAKAIGDEEDRAQALASLAPHLSPRQIAEALAAAKAIGNERDRARALGSLAPHLSPEQIAEALAAAKAIGDEEDRAQALESLAPHLSPEQTAEALAAAKAIGNERDRAHALGSLAPHLSPEQIAEALVAAKAIGDEEDRAQALESLAPHLSPEQTAEALAAAKAIGNERDRAHALGSLAPHLSPEQIAEALAAAKAIDDEEDRAQALESLAPHLSPEQTAEALAAAKAIRNEGARAHALGSVAHYATPIQYATLLDSLAETAARLPRAQALAAVAASMDISAALGGAEGLEAIRRAINDTARWYP